MAVILRAGERCQVLTVIETEALYMSPEQPGEQARQAASSVSHPEGSALGTVATS